MYNYIKTAVAVPKVQVADVEFNKNEIIKKIKQAKDNNADILVFPELCVSGYTCQDLFFQKTLTDSCVYALEEIAKVCKNIAVVVGAPLFLGNGLYNCGVFLCEGEIKGIGVKTFIPNYNEFYENRWFSSADDLLINSITSKELGLSDDYEIPVGDDLIFNLNDKVKVSIEICEDMWAPVTPGSLLALNGAQIILNLSAGNEIISKRQARKEIVKSNSLKGLCGYVYSSAGEGESTTDLAFAGHSFIYESGSLVCENQNFFDGDYILYGDIDLDKIVSDRKRIKTFSQCSKIYGTLCDVREIFVDKGNFKSNGEHIKSKKMPFVPSNKEDREKRCLEVLEIQCAGLKKRWSVIGGKAVIGISGGLDSTLALLVAVKTAKLLDKPMTDIVGITMPCFGTTDRTYNNALKLMEALGIESLEINIKDACLKHFEDIGHSKDDLDLTFENAQARERAQVLMDYAGKVGGFVVGTGDLSELALGWCTYNADHMSMYSVNSSVPKTLIRYIVDAISELDSFKECKDILKDIVNTPISPELLPPDESGKIAQKTETLVGPYELSDFFLYNMLRYGFDPKKIYHLAQDCFKDDYTSEEILKWLKNFYKRFFTQQFKRSCMPDGIKVGNISLSPRGDLKMPSDATYTLWLKQLEEL